MGGQPLSCLEAAVSTLTAKQIGQSRLILLPTNVSETVLLTPSIPLFQLLSKEKCGFSSCFYHKSGSKILLPGLLPHSPCKSSRPVR